MTPTQEKLAKAIMTEMKLRRMHPDEFTTMPAGFWKAVAGRVGKTPNLVNSTFNRNDNRQKFLEYISAHWNELSSDIINPDIIEPADNLSDNLVTHDIDDKTEDNHDAQVNFVTDDMTDKVETTQENSNVIAPNMPDRNDNDNDVTHDKIDKVEPELNPSPNIITHDRADIIGRREVECMIAELETRLSHMIKITHDKADKLESGAPFDKANRPPDPPKTGKTNKKLAGEKRDIRTRIDKVLFDLVELDAVAHFGGNWGKALDAILWRYYEKPTLSFETD